MFKSIVCQRFLAAGTIPLPVALTAVTIMMGTTTLNSDYLPQLLQMGRPCQTTRFGMLTHSKIDLHPSLVVSQSPWTGLNCSKIPVYLMPITMLIKQMTQTPKEAWAMGQRTM